MTSEVVDIYKDKVSSARHRIMRGDQRGFELSYPDPRTGQGVIITYGITKAANDEAFEAAFRHVKRMVRAQLRRVSSIRAAWATTEHTVTIIMTGRSSLHPAFITWMEEYCAQLSLPKPINLEFMAQFCG